MVAEALIVRCAFVVSVILAGVSLYCAIDFHRSGLPTPPGWAFGMLGFWALMPPVAFWIHWAWLVDRSNAREMEYQQHMHGLCRNIWIAFTAVLALLFGIAPFSP
jgi:hypothetical protein